MRLAEMDKAQKTTQFTRALENMKTLAEGGTLCPLPLAAAERGSSSVEQAA